MLQLEGQLTSLQDEAAVRQAEMQAAIDGLRQDKRALEAQVAGVDLHAVEAGDPLVLQVLPSAGDHSQSEKSLTYGEIWNCRG